MLTVYEFKECKCALYLSTRFGYRRTYLARDSSPSNFFRVYRKREDKNGAPFNLEQGCPVILRVGNTLIVQYSSPLSLRAVIDSASAHLQTKREEGALGGEGGVTHSIRGTEENRRCERNSWCASYA